MMTLSANRLTMLMTMTINFLNFPMFLLLCTALLMLLARRRSGSLSLQGLASWSTTFQAALPKLRWVSLRPTGREKPTPSPLQTRTSPPRSLLRALVWQQLNQLLRASWIS